MPGRSRRPKKPSDASASEQQVDEATAEEPRGNDFSQAMLGERSNTEELSLLEALHSQAEGDAMSWPDTAELHGRIDDLLHEARDLLASVSDREGFEDYRDLMNEINERMGELLKQP